LKGFTPRPGENGLSTRDHPAQILIRAAELAPAKDRRCGQSVEAPTPAEELGLTIGLIRRRKNLSVYDLASKAGCSAETIIALEAGILPTERVVQLLLPILRGLGIRLNAEIFENLLP
jgi:DNA-binding XRE family transcriptional regulator